MKLVSGRKPKKRGRLLELHLEALGAPCGNASGVPVGAPLGTWVGTRGALRGALHPKSLETSKTYETLGFLHPLRRANEARK